MTTLAKLKDKYLVSADFRQEMRKAENNYQILHQRVMYSNISEADTFFMQKFKGKTRIDIDIYFIFATYQNIKASTLDKLTLNFIAKLPKPSQFYMLVYFNDQQFPEAFPNLKTVLQVLPYEYSTNLVKLFIVKPTFRERASRIFVFGTIPKYINSRIENVDSLKQLQEHLTADLSEIVRSLPPDIKSLFNDELQIEKKTKPKGKITQSQIPITKNEQSNINNNTNLHKTMGPSVQKYQKSPNKKYQIDQYNKTENGLPQAFQILVFYFKEHPEGTQQQGIFRKSANILQQNQAIDDLSSKKFDKIGKIENPHIIANLIKRFLRDLATPIIPYHIFHKIMDEPTLTPEFLCKKIKQLATISMTKVLTFMFLLEFLISDIISKSAINKMTAHNIAICFGPCIMWAKQKSAKDLQYALKSAQVLTMIINNFQLIFGTPKDQKRLYRSSYLSHRKKQRQTALNLPQSNNQTGSSSIKKKSQQDSDDDYTDIKLNLVSKLKQINNPTQKVQSSKIDSKEQLNKLIKKGVFTSNMPQKKQQNKEEFEKRQPEQTKQKQQIKKLNSL